MSYHARSPTTSSSTLIVVSPFPLDHHHNGITVSPKKPVLKLVTAAPHSGWSFPEVQLDKWMSGKGFIEPHRNNLPRRKRKVVHSTEDIVHEIDKTFPQAVPPTSEAGPRSPIEESIHSSSLNTNITEPPTSLRASPIPSAPLHNSLALSNPPPTFPSYPVSQTPKLASFRLNDPSPRSSPQISPSKGHLQPTSATLPRRHRSIREQERRRRSMVEQQTILAAKEVSRPKICQTRADAEADFVSNLDSGRQSGCAQELSNGIILGFLAEGEKDADTVVRIKVYDGSSTPLSSPPSPSSAPSSSSSSVPHLELSLPTDLLCYPDGTTSLTDSQIQQACSFIDEQLAEPSSTLVQPARRPSVLILAPRLRPEEAMSIGVSYLAGIEDVEKKMEGYRVASDDDYGFPDYTYTTVHRLLMAFHDAPGSPILESPGYLRREPNFTAGCGIVTDGRSGLRPEWRGVLSFEGMQRLDKVWSPTLRRSRLGNSS